LDFYYTTATIKTVLDHPTRGSNQLFRAQVTSKQYVDIMKNPFAHTGRDSLIPSTPRYNMLRPNYAGQHVSSQLYPDPTVFGWKFTGSAEESRVEFFEKKMDTGDVVKLDFYYTTATIKTVLDHPTRGSNQLFRAQVTSKQYVDIMKNPRAHTGQGYRRKENRRTDRSIGNRKDKYDEFDRVPSIQNETDMGDTNTPDVSANATYYARDDNYDFKKQGHLNRRDQMSKLHQSSDYDRWKEAIKKEYAVIHAKFYVSLPKKMHRQAPPNGSRSGFNQRRGRQANPLPLPEQSTVMDIKAAENATLGTKYEATDPSLNMGRSSVRMERINGLKDDKQWKGDPVFEKKLYYRAEKVVNGEGCDEDSDEMMSEDENEGANEECGSLNEYKTAKIDQVKQYYSDLNEYITDPEEAEERLRSVKNKIHMSQTNADVDDVVKMFHSDLTHREIVDSTNMKCL